MTRDKKAKIGATIGLMFFIMLFIEPMIFNTGFMLIVVFVIFVVGLIILLWKLMYFLFCEFF